jgi:hypothetical protein
MTSIPKSLLFQLDLHYFLVVDLLAEYFLLLLDFLDDLLHLHLILLNFLYYLHLHRPPPPVDVIVENIESVPLYHFHYQFRLEPAPPAPIVTG